MGTTKDFLDYALTQLEVAQGITYRPMMGEYLLYRDGVLFGGIYDNRVLIKTTKNNAEYHLPTELPYEGAKRLMYMLDDLENAELVKTILLTTCTDLPKNEIKIPIA